MTTKLFGKGALFGNLALTSKEAPTLHFKEHVKSNQYLTVYRLAET